MQLALNLSPEVILAIFSSMFVSLICVLLLNELSDKKLRRVFSRPKLDLVKQEYKKELKKIAR